MERVNTIVWFATVVSTFSWLRSQFRELGAIDPYGNGHLGTALGLGVVVCVFLGLGTNRLLNRFDWDEEE